MDVKFSVTSRDTNGDSAAKSFGNINTKYIAQVGVQDLTPGSIGGVLLPYDSTGAEVYATFWHWSDAVGRALLALSSNTYIDSTVTASWGVGEEVED